MRTAVPEWLLWAHSRQALLLGNEGTEPAGQAFSPAESMAPWALVPV